MRVRLLTAAATLLREKGYSNFRTAEVASLARVSRGAQLHHYPTKESLVLATIEHLFASAQAATEQRVRRDASPDELLTDIADDAWAFYFSKDFPAALQIVASGSKDSELALAVNRITTAYRRPVEHAWIHKLVASGVPPSDAEQVVWTIQSVVRGLAMRARFAYETGQLERTLQLTLRLCRQHAAGLRAP